MNMSPGESFVHRQNLKGLKKQLGASTNEAHRKMLLRLLALEEAKDEQFGDEGQTGARLPTQCRLKLSGLRRHVGNFKMRVPPLQMTSCRDREVGAA
jgi:hypothetical protein